MAGRTAIELLSSLRRGGNSTALAETPETYFLMEDERQAFAWLKSFVRQYRAFPDPGTFLEHTGIQTLAVMQPLRYYLDKSKQAAVYRSSVGIYSKLQEAMADKNTADIVKYGKELSDLDIRFAAPHDRRQSFNDVIQSVVADYDEAEMSFELRGITTGFPFLDAVTHGYQNGDVATWLGRPGDGKTQLLLLQAYAAWEAGRSVLFLSNELVSLQVARRLLGIHTKLNPEYIRTGRLGTILKRRLLVGAREIQSGVPMEVVAGNFKKSTGSLRALVEELSPDIIFIDASYLMQPEKKSNSRRELLADVSEEIKSIAMDFNRPVVQSVQFNRQAAKPSASRQREESGEARPGMGHNGGPALHDPLAYLNLNNIGETDVVAQVSSLLFGIGIPDAPFERIRRWIKTMKGREGEDGRWLINYDFDRMDFSQVPYELQNRVPGANLNWML